MSLSVFPLHVDTLTRFHLEQEAARQQRLRDLASDMNDVLLSEKNERKENDAAAPGGSKQGQKGKKYGKAGGAMQGNGASRAASDLDEDEDEQTLCIVCMTEKRNACLVHGRTSHQVRVEFSKARSCGGNGVVLVVLGADCLCT